MRALVYLLPVLVIVGLAYARLHYRALKRRLQLEHDAARDRLRREESEWIDRQVRKDTL